MGKKRKFEVEQKDNNEFGLPAKFLATSHVRSQEKRLIVVLEGAQLETVKVNTFSSWTTMKSFIKSNRKSSSQKNR